MEQIEVLSDVARRLDSLGLPWILVASYASRCEGLLNVPWSGKKLLEETKELWEAEENSETPH